ncbi:conserved hypothetical protein [Bathymodiolus platifrons methanotrophic gill symbiont]|nr:conserved hypothetical protein [Bathymodiolus platifrons methanotrophic gill symbiont]
MNFLLMPRIVITLKEKEKEAWESFCSSQKMTGSGMLRKLITHVTKGQIIFNSKKNKTPKEGIISMRFNSKDVEEIEKRAKKEGFENRSQWGRALILNKIDNHPTFTIEEIKAIVESNRQLSAIGRNLNQITRALNIDATNSNSPSEELLISLSKTIDNQQGKIMSLLDQSLNRWSE